MCSVYIFVELCVFVYVLYSSEITLLTTFRSLQIKTTSPEKYRVRPSVGVLEPGTQLDVSVTVSEQLAPSTLVRDKFLVMGAPASSVDLSSQEVSQLFKVSSVDCTPLF